VAEGRDLNADKSFELGLNCLLDRVGALVARVATKDPGQGPAK